MQYIYHFALVTRSPTLTISCSWSIFCRTMKLTNQMSWPCGQQLFRGLNMTFPQDDTIVMHWCSTLGLYHRKMSNSLQSYSCMTPVTSRLIDHSFNVSICYLQIFTDGWSVTSRIVLTSTYVFGFLQKVPWWSNKLQTVRTRRPNYKPTPLHLSHFKTKVMC